MDDEFIRKSFNWCEFRIFDIRLHDSQTEENRVQTAGSDRVDEGSREALQGEENVGRTQRGTLIIEQIN